MNVVEAFVGRNKMGSPDDSSQLHEGISSILFAGIAHNTQGNVYVPEVYIII